MKLKLALLVGLFAFGFAMSASAGAVVDTDGDLVPDQFDNCSADQNGPNQGSNQVDSDLDGYGNRCDADYDNSLTTTALDFGQFLSTFGTNSLGETDHDGSGTITALDFGIFLGKFSGTANGGNAPGPSGLACAGTTPCTP
ncbi:MAG: thrombospondin type 3 repeat-containing protein [Myxococcota bacterium]